MTSRIISFWGKGGVGKTTCAASVASVLSSHGKTLLVSSDPTPSLSDILGVNLSGTPRRVSGNLWAIEISEKDVIGLWKKRFGEEVYNVLSSLIPVDRDIIDYIAGAPGIADQFMLYYIYEVWRSREFNYVVWDTVAAGGGIRLLRIEKEFYTHLGDAVKMYLKLKGFFDRLKRGSSEPLKLVESWRLLAEEVLAMLSSDEHYVYIVSIPEKLGLVITEKILDEFRLLNMVPRGIIFNMVLDENICPNCDFIRKRMGVQKKYLEEFKKLYGDKYGITVIPLLAEGPRGLKELKDFSRYLGAIFKEFL